MSHLAYVCNCFYYDDEYAFDPDHARNYYVCMDNVDNCVFWAKNHMENTYTDHFFGLVKGFYVGFNEEKQYCFCSCSQRLIEVGNYITLPKLDPETSHSSECLWRFDLYLQERKQARI